MKQSFKALIGAVAVASIVAAAGVASAQNTAEEAACAGAIGKNIAKYQATLAKNQAGCHKSRSGGKVSSATDCNDAIGADIKLKRGPTRTKISTAIADACALAGPAMLASQYPRCPSPAATSDNGLATTEIDSYAEVATCLMDLSEAYVDRIGETAMGNPTMTATLAGTISGATNNKGLLKCQGTIGKAIGKVIKTDSGTRAKCQTAKVKDLLGLDYTTCGAGAGDPSLKIAATLTALDTAISDACSPAVLVEDADTAKADLDRLGMCGDTVAELQGCIRDRAVEPTADGLAAAIFEFPNDGAGNLNCASSADIIINAGYGRKLTNSRLDSGFSGLAHNVDVVDESQGGVILQNCNADCENCEVRIDVTQGYCRCEGALSNVQCDEIELPDADDCGGGTCHCMFGPPLPLSSGGTPVCVVNRFASDFSGGTSVVGAYDVATRTRALVHTGLDMIRPCPTCEGGFCNGGTRDTLACTIDATHPDFGATSFDCPPTAGAMISGLNLALEFTSGTVGFTASIPAGTNCAAGTCHCSQCSGDASIGCATTADCTAVSAGTCGQNLGVNNPKQNGCTAGVADCVANVNDPGMGKCSTDTLVFCDGQLRQNGEGILPCNNNGDCEALDTIEIDYGACEHLGDRSCFLPAISATGTPGIFSSEGVSTFCSASTASAAVNQAGGLPGPGRVKLDFDFNVRCSSGGALFELPGGSNCP